MRGDSLLSSGYPRHRENSPKNSLAGKRQGIWKFCQNIFSSGWIGLPSQFCVCNSHKLCKLAQGEFAVGQGKN